MMIGFSSPHGSRGPPLGNQPHGTNPGGSNLHSGKGFKLSGSILVKNKLKLHLAMPFTADNKVNPVLLLSKLLETAKMFDPSSCLKSANPSLSPIMMVSKIPKDEKIFEYAFDLQTLATKQQFVFFATLETSASFNDLKYNSAFFSWLQKHRFWVGINTMKTNHITQLNFLFGLHLTLSSHNNMKESLDPYMDNIKYNLIPASTFYINEKGERVKTQVTKLQVDSVKVNKACDSIASAWLDPTFLRVLSTCLVSKSIKFISYPKKGLMSVEVFCSAVRQQYEFNNNMITISIMGIGGLEVEVTCHGNRKTLIDFIHSLRDEMGNPIFNSIEPTKFTAAEGHWLFITQKMIMEEAEKLIDNLFEQLALEGLLDAFTMDGHKIRHLHQTQLKHLSQYAEGLAKKFKPMPVIMIPPPMPAPPTHNAWKLSSTRRTSRTLDPHLVIIP